MAKKGQSSGLDTSDIEKGLSLEERRQRVLSNIGQLREQEINAIRNSSKLTDEQSAQLKNNIKELKKINNILDEINKSQREQISNFKAAGDSIASMSELQEELKHHLAGAAKEGIKFAQSIDTAGAGTKDTFKKGGEFAANALTSIAELAQLNKEDGVAIAAKAADLAYYTNGLKEQISVLDGNLNSLSIQEQALLDSLIAQRDTIAEQTKEAGRFASMSKETKALHEELNEDLESINKTFKKVTTAAEVFFSSTRNMIGMALFGAGELAHKFHEVGREMGYSLTQATGFKSQILLAGILSEESAEAVKELGKELGDTSHISNGMAADAAMLAYHYKLSGEQAAYLSTAFGELQGQSWDTGQNTLKYVSALAAANGVMPGEAMKDIAENSEFMAKFTQEGGKNIGEAAIAAAKLGIGLGTAEKMADHLLDYQTSVSDEMEASVLLGRDLNLGKARELAYNGKIAESMEAGLEAIGGISEYNKMDYYQRQAVAKALGVSNAEMQKMVAHEETLKGMHGVAAQQYERISTLMHVIGDSMAGKVLKGMGGLVLSGVQLSSQMAMIGDKMPGLQKAFGYLAKPFDFLIGKVADFIGLIGRAIAKMIGLKAAQSGLDAGTSMAGPLTKAGLPDKRFKANKTPSTAATPGKDMGGGGADQASKFGKIKMGDVIRAAVALLILAAALFVFAKAANAFGNDINWENVMKGIGAIFVLGVAAGLLSLFGTEILVGAGALLIASVAFYVFGLAAQQVAIGIGMFGEALKKVDVGQMALFGLALIPLGIGMAAFGFLSPLILLGSIALLALGGAMALLGPGLLSFSASMATLDVGKLALFGLALIPLGIGLAIFGALIQPIMMGALALLLFGTALGVLVAGAAGMGATLGGIQTYVTGLIAIVPQILSLALAFSALALSLAMIGQMGIAALPVLAGLAIGGGILMALMGGGSGASGGKEDTSTKLLEEIMGLRKDMSDGKIAVYIDGKKMNTGLAISNKRQPT